MATLLETMILRLQERIAAAPTPYKQFIYLSDIHFIADQSNPGFQKILNQIEKEKNDTLFILTGGDSVDRGYQDYYNQFKAKCEEYYKKTKIPIIPTMGNHEFYVGKANKDAIKLYKQNIGETNFTLDIPKKGLGDTLRIVAFNDAMPRKTKKIQYPNRKKACQTTTNDYHLFYYPKYYITPDPKQPAKYSGFRDNINNTDAKHIIVTMHVPPRRNPLPKTMDSFIRKEYKECLKVNKIITEKDLLAYYRDLWMLVHGQSTPDKNDSTKWFIDEVMKQKKVEMVLTGHIHTYYPFALTENKHTIQFVVSGGGGNSSAEAVDDKYPVTTYHYLRIKYDSANKKYIYEKVNAGNKK